MAVRGYTACQLLHGWDNFFMMALAPWPSSWPIGIILGLGGLAGLAYQIHAIVMRHEVDSVLLDWHDWLP
jgi:hypothetical protein